MITMLLFSLDTININVIGSGMHTYIFEHLICKTQHCQSVSNNNDLITVCCLHNTIIVYVLFLKGSSRNHFKMLICAYLVVRFLLLNNLWCTCSECFDK